MPKYSKSFVKVGNPYCLLALNVFLEAFRDIECYLRGEGTLEERLAGKESIVWIREMKGNFKILAGSSDYSIEEFHQLCIRRINDIKREAYKSKNEKIKLGRKN